jgi:hypothetical protein
LPALSEGSCGGDMTNLRSKHVREAASRHYVLHNDGAAQAFGAARALVRIVSTTLGRGRRRVVGGRDAFYGALR